MSACLRVALWLPLPRQYFYFQEVLPVLAAKHCIMQANAELHQSVLAKQKKRFGEEIARLQVPRFPLALQPFRKTKNKNVVSTTFPPLFDQSSTQQSWLRLWRLVTTSTWALRIWQTRSTDPSQQLRKTTTLSTTTGCLKSKTSSKLAKQRWSNQPPSHPHSVRNFQVQTADTPPYWDMK